MAVELDNVAERIFAIDHPIRLLAWEIVADLAHAHAPAVALDELDPPLEIRILEADMEHLGTPVLERQLLRPGLGN